MAMGCLGSLLVAFLCSQAAAEGHKRVPTGGMITASPVCKNAGGNVVADNTAFDATLASGQQVEFKAMNSGTAFMVRRKADNIAGDMVLPSKFTVTTAGYDCVDIPVTKVEAWGFGKNPETLTGLTSVVLEEGYTVVGDRSFFHCVNLASFIIPSTVTLLDIRAFASNKITSIVVPPLCTSLTEGLFQDCQSLKTIRILGNIANFGQWAFNNVNHLETIFYCGTRVPEPLVTGTLPFTGSQPDSGPVIRVTHDYPNANWCGKSVTRAIDSSTDSNGITYQITEHSRTVTISSAEEKTLTQSSLAQLCVGCISEVIIEDKIVALGGYAFQQFGDALKSVTIHSSLTTIWEYCFFWCTSLAEINIPETVNFIGIRGFSHCRSIKQLVLPKEVTNIREGFIDFGYGLTEVNITATSLSQLGQWSFHECISLQKVFFCGSSNPGAVGKGAFTADSGHTAPPESMKVYVPSGYNGNAFAERSGNVVELGDEIFFDVINDGDLRYSFNGNRLSITGTGPVKKENVAKVVTSPALCASCSSIDQIEEVVLDARITEIGQESFKGCTKLASINIPEGLITIGASAFNGCTSLTIALDLPDTVSNIGQNCFAQTGLSSVHFPSSLTVISAGSFENCTNLASINIPEALITIGASAFNGCTKLAGDVTFPSTLTTMGELCFSQCGFSSINITSNLAAGTKSFSGCTTLTFVKIKQLNNPSGINGLFFGCSKLKEIQYCSSEIVTKDPSSTDGPFDGCPIDLKILVPFGYSGTFADHAVEPTFDAECHVPTLAFTESGKFTSTRGFSDTGYFTASSRFRATQHFTATSWFRETLGFTESKHFPASSSFLRTFQFTESKSFTPSSGFVESPVFTTSDRFAASGSFMPSNAFTYSGKFVSTDSFSNSVPFLQTSQFEQSVPFVSTSMLTKSESFAQSDAFTESDSLQVKTTYVGIATDSEPMFTSAREGKTAVDSEDMSSQNLRTVDHHVTSESMAPSSDRTLIQSRESTAMILSPSSACIATLSLTEPRSISTVTQNVGDGDSSSPLIIETSSIAVGTTLQSHDCSESVTNAFTDTTTSYGVSTTCASEKRSVHYSPTAESSLVHTFGHVSDVSTATFDSDSPATSKATDLSEGSGGSKTGMIIGIVFGVLVLVVIVVVLVWFFVLRRRKESKPDSTSDGFELAQETAMEVTGSQRETTASFDAEELKVMQSAMFSNSQEPEGFDNSFEEETDLFDDDPS